jgi:flagellar biosynthesis/type III secretory pathway M-ring protein FliF/YscJ
LAKATASLFKKEEEKKKKGKKKSLQVMQQDSYTWLVLVWHILISLFIQIITSKKVRMKMSHPGTNPEIMCISFDHMF